MLQHSYSTEKINRLHTEAKNVRLSRQVKTSMWRKTLASYLNYVADRLDNVDTLDKELDLSLEGKATV